jgi:putative ABC transport system substrate-binding protein
MLSRRAFLAAALAAASARLAAQDKPARIYRIGFLDPVSLESNAANMAEFRKGLREAGYVEGRNLQIEYRSGEGRRERFARLANDLARQNIDLIVTSGTPATIAANSVPGNLPVVTATVADPVDTRLVDSLEKPGGKVTGVAVVVNELEAKRIDLLRALAPGKKRLAALMDMGNPAFESVWKATEAAAKSLGLEPQLVDVRKPEGIQKGFDAAMARRAELLVVRFNALAPQNRQLIVELAAKHRLPAMYPSRQFVDAGGLVSYGVNSPDMYYRAAMFVDKILKGAKAAELPMERPAKFEFIINRRTARTLDLVIPPDLLLRSNQLVG